MTRQVSLADDAYETLARLRRPDESFSDVVRRLGETARQEALLSVIGAWKMPAEEAERLTREIYARRRAGKPRKPADL